MRKRKLLFVLLLVLLPFIGWAQKNNYQGQHVSIKLATGDSIQLDLDTPYKGLIKPVIKEGQVAWSFKEAKDLDRNGAIDVEELNNPVELYSLDNVESIDFRSFEYDERESRKALIEFYQAMDGDNWPEEYKENWCSDKPIWEWYGVNWLSSDLKPWVNELDVQSLGLESPRPIPECISRMGPIRFLWLSSNNFNGSIPEFIGWNFSLMHLELGHNNLSGLFPESFKNFAKIPIFWAFGAESNKFEGSLPEEFIVSLMDKIPGNNLNLINNYYTGKVPESIKNHQNFSNFWVSFLPQKGTGLNLSDVNIPAPVFTTIDINGNPIDLAEIYKNNEYTLLYKWGWWCPYSEAFNQMLVPAYNAYKDKGFEVIGLHQSEDDKLPDYLNSHDIPWNNMIYDDWFWNADGDGNRNAAIFAWGGTPTVFLVDKNGNIVFNDLMDENGHWVTSNYRYNLFTVLGDKLGPIDYNFYTSTDYSRDGEVTTLQTTSYGQGIDLVFVGEGFTDKDIEDGTFDQRMNEAVNQFFAYEPYWSLRDRFNIYAVKAVSPNAEFYGDGIHAIDEDNVKALEYASKVPNLIEGRPMHVNVIYNNNSGGRSYCTMFEDNSFVCYAMDGVTAVLNHEAGGHGIGKLFDEYVEQGKESLILPDDNKTELENIWTTLGWGANVDWRSNPTEVKWAKFISDARYADEKIGVYEGCYLYGKNAYRPTENSMMRYNDTPFNAPSREEIYKRVMKESEGDSWTYDYEEFVAFDESGRNQFVDALNANRARAKNKKQQTRQVQRTAPPVFVKGTWRDALKKK